MRLIHTIHTDASGPSAVAARSRMPSLQRRFPWVLAALLAAACSDASEGPPTADDNPGTLPPNTLTQAERAAGWRLLFDGETTDGWRGYYREQFPDTGWAVMDGMLVVGATSTDPDVAIGGDIVTTESFTNFDLRFEFMLSEVANSGVLYRVIEEEGAAIWHNAPEYQVLDDPAYIEMGTMDMNTHLTGDNYDLHASGDKTLHPPGEWNQGRIRILGNVVEHWLNGTKTVEYELGSYDWKLLVQASKFQPYPRYGTAPSGPIGLQDHGRNVWYRNVKILPLEPVSIFNGEDLDGWQVNGTERWYVEDGELVCESGPDAQYGYLTTEQTYPRLRSVGRFQAGGRRQQRGVLPLQRGGHGRHRLAGRGGAPRHGDRGDLRVVRAGLAGAAQSGERLAAAHG